MNGISNKIGEDEFKRLPVGDQNYILFKAIEAMQGSFAAKWVETLARGFIILVLTSFVGGLVFLLGWSSVHTNRVAAESITTSQQ